MEREVLASRVGLISNTAYYVKHKIAGSPGVLDELLEKIRGVVEGIKDKIIKALEGPLEVIRRISESLYNAIGRIVDTVAGLAERITAAITEKLWAFLESMWGKVLENIRYIVDRFREALEALKDEIVGLGAAIWERIGELVTSLKDKLSEVITKVTDKISDIVDGIKDFAGRVKDAIIEMAKRLGETISDAYQRATQAITRTISDIWERIKDTWERIYQKLSETYDRIVDYVNSNVLQPIHDTWDKTGKVVSFKGSVLLKAALGQYDSWDSFQADLSDPIPIAGGLGAVIGGLLLGVVIAPALATALTPALENLTHLASEKFRPSLLSTSTAIEAWHREVISTEELRRELAKLGYSDRRQDVLIQTAWSLPSPGQIQEAFLRGMIDEATHDKLLRQHGYHPSMIELFKSLYLIIPMPSDLIRMAVREAFSPEVARKFGQYEDFPEAFATWAEKQGISREWAERYWAAHWDLPSATMGFEMLHRGIIDENELKLLLRALDVMPFWREKLIKLSYVPYTRVDVRRMYQIGILDYEDVIRAYKDLGYDDQKAKNLAEFTVRYYAEEDKTEIDEYKQLTRGIYATAFKRGIINRDEYRLALFKLGYTAEDADLLVKIAEAELAVSDTKEEALPRKTQTASLVFNGLKRGLFTKAEAREAWLNLGFSSGEADWYLFLAEYEHSAEVRATYIEAIHRKYVERTLTKAEAQAALGYVIVTSEEINRLFELWDVEREARTRKPTEAQFRAALRAGLISIEEYREELRGLGFDEKYVEMLANLALKGG